MTRYFEVLRRDGPARLGKLISERPITTPTILNREDYISLGSILSYGTVEGALESVRAHSGKKKLVIYPYVPSGSPLKLDQGPQEGPRGSVVYPQQPVEPKADVYVLGNAGSLFSPRELVTTTIALREKIPPDAALYVPAHATPSNLALLLYLGADLVDGTKMIMDGYYGRYHTRDGVFPLSQLQELPCRCQHCQGLCMDLPPEERAVRLAAHNSLKLEEEILRARWLIRHETMREYVERQVRVSTMQTSALRILDQEHTYLERRAPTLRRSLLYANTAESLSRVEVTRFAERVLTRYRPPQSDVLLLLPCSARKPYSRSRSHRLFYTALGSYRKYLHEVILTSPLALVPRELEDVYPAASYDVPVTGRWDLEERAWLLRNLDLYLEKNRYARVVAHLEGELRETVEDHGIEAVYTEGGTGDEGLRDLTEAVEEACRGARRLPSARLRSFGAKADYFFGPGASDHLFSDKVQVKGHEVQSEEGQTLVAETIYGTLALSLEGGRRLAQRGAYVVRIGDFLPKGTVLAPGVEDADEQIRPGDEVIVAGERAFGVGRARMSGWEMVSASRGIAVDLRQVEGI